MTARCLRFVSGVGAAVLLCGASTGWAQTTGNAQSFAIVGGAAVNANGSGSSVAGDVGISPAAATNITGFPANATIVPPFSNHGHDSFAIAAEASADALYNSAELAPAGGVATGANLSTSGPTANGHYTPGKYFVNVGTALLPAGSQIFLDGPGTYIFTVNSDFTANVGSSVVLNGVNPCSVWWRVPTQATLNGVLSGNVVSNALIALGPSATLAGRALTTAPGSVTLAGSNVIGGCSVPASTPGPLPVPAPALPIPHLFITKGHQGNFVVGTNATYSIALFNNGSVATSGSYTITDTLPAGLTFVSATGVGWSCTASGQTVTCTSSTVVAPGPGPNNILITVTPGAAAVPVVTNNAVVTGGGDTAPSANTTIDVTIVSPALPSVPTLSQWAMIALTLLLALAGVAALRRRNT